MNHSATRAVNGLVGQHATRQVVAVAVHGGKPPHRFEGHHFLHANLAVNGSGKLTDVFETALFKEFENFPIPLVVLEGVDFVILCLNEVGEHPIGEGHGRDGHGFSTLGLNHIKTRFGEHRGFGSVRIHV